MTISRFQISRVLILTSIVLAVIWVVGGFYVLNLNHLWLGQGAFGFQWGTTFAYHVGPNRGPFFAYRMAPEYRSFVFPPLTATLPAGIGSRVRIHQLTILFLPILLALASMSFLIYSPRKPKDRTLCPKCNYSLTGNTSGVCPECGTAVASAES